MGLFDFIFGNNKKKEEKRIAIERNVEQEHQQQEEDERIRKKREYVLAKNKRKEEANQRLKQQQEKKRLEKLANGLSKNFHSPIYKEDKYSDMIRSATFNPFKLTCDPFENSNLKFGNMVEIFKNELNVSLSKAKAYGMPLDQMLGGYIFNMIENWYNNAGYVPKAAVDAIIEQIYIAVKLTSFADIVDNIDQLKYLTYWNLTHH